MRTPCHTIAEISTINFQTLSTYQLYITHHASSYLRYGYDGVQIRTAQRQTVRATGSAMPGCSVRRCGDARRCLARRDAVQRDSSRGATELITVPLSAERTCNIRAASRPSPSSELRKVIRKIYIYTLAAGIASSLYRVSTDATAAGACCCSCTHRLLPVTWRTAAMHVH